MCVAYKLYLLNQLHKISLLLVNECRILKARQILDELIHELIEEIKDIEKTTKEEQYENK